MSDKKKENLNHGSSLDDFLTKEGVLQQFQGEVIKRVMAWLIKNQV